MKTILVTGATDGIGRETARQLLEKNLRVLVHGRTLDKARRTADELVRLHPGGKVEAVYGDLAQLRDVLALAEQVREKAPELDVLINNAGVYEHQRRLTVDGLEHTMAVNHFAPFLLTQALLPLLQAAPEGRVVVVSSIAHESGQLNVDNLNFARSFSGYGAYSASKLANVLFTIALARRLAQTTVTANCLHPGVIDTKLLRSGFGSGGASVTVGARTPIYLALSDEVRHVSGHYFVNCRLTLPSRTARDPELAETLWRATEQALSSFLPLAGFAGLRR